MGFPPQSIIECQSWAKAPGILREETNLFLSRPFGSVSQIHVLARFLVEPGIAIDRNHAACQHRIDSLRIGSVTAGGAGKIRGCKHRVGGVIGIDTEIDARNKSLLIESQCRPDVLAAEGEAVSAMCPRQRIVDLPIQRIAPKRLGDGGRSGDTCCQGYTS